MSRAILCVGFAAIVAMTGCTGSVSGTGAPAATATSAAPPTAPAPTTSCAGASVASRDDVDLAQVLPATTPRGLPVRADRTRALTLDVLSIGLDEPARGELRRDLTTAGFRDGYERSWSAGAGDTAAHKVEGLTVLRFATPAGACWFQAREASRRVLQPVSVPGLPGTVGTSSTTPLNGAARLATKGTYFVEANAIVYGRSADPTAAWSTETLRAAYAVL